MGNNHNVSGLAMNYDTTFPKLITLLKSLTVDHNFSSEQFSMFVKMALEADCGLATEIEEAFRHQDFSWMEILNCEAVGEVFDTDSSSEADEFAREYLLIPARELLAS